MLTNIKVVFRSSSYFFIKLLSYSSVLTVELDAGAAGRPKEIRKEGWQHLEHYILQAGKENNASVKG